MVKMINSKVNNVLIITAVFPPEPVVSAQLSFDIADSLSARNSVTVISPRPSRPLGFQFIEEPKKNNFEHNLLDSYVCSSSSFLGRFFESFSFGKHSYQYIANNANNIDIIYANTWPLMGQFFAVIAAKKYRIPIITHVQDIYPESLFKKVPFLAPIFKLFFLPLDKFVLSNSEKVIANSEKMKEHLICTRNLKLSKIEVIRNWQNESTYIDSKPDNLSKLFTFMYLGSINPTAGVDLLIRSFLKAELKNAQLIIAGSGSDLKRCIEISSQYKNNNIHFVDAPMPLVPSIQSAASVLLLPLKKGIGMTASPSKLPSYMFSAKPIIACVDDQSDTENVILESNCGWVLQPDNEFDLIQTMRKVIKLKKEELQQKGANGFEYAITHFSRLKNLKKLINLIEETLTL